MKPKKRINKTVWIALVVVVALQALFDPLSSLMLFSESVQARIGLPYARRKWEAQGITHYKFDIRGYVPLVCIVGGSVEVKDGVVVHTGPSTDALTRGEPDLDLGFWSTASLPLCDYRNYTIPIFFDMMEQYSRSITQISFDPTHGFISRFRLGCPGGYGLLSPRIFDCCSNFQVFNFVALDE